MSQVSAASPELFLLEDQADFKEYAVKLVMQTRRTLCILSRDLDADVFGSDAFITAVSQLARTSRYVQVQLLVQNTKHLVQTGHKLARLSQRLSTKIMLRKLTLEPENTDMGFMLCDTNALLYKNDESAYRGFVNLDAAVEVKRLKEVFDYIWQYGEAEPELQILHI